MTRKSDLGVASVNTPTPVVADGVVHDRSEDAHDLFRLAHEWFEPFVEEFALTADQQSKASFFGFLERDAVLGEKSARLEAPSAS